MYYEEQKCFVNSCSVCPSAHTDQIRFVLFKSSSSFKLVFRYPAIFLMHLIIHSGHNFSFSDKIPSISTLAAHSPSNQLQTV